MKLRNKKTGEIFCWDEKYIPFGFGLPHPASLAEINEEWEDYKEPKKHWFIDAGGEVEEAIYLTENDKDSLINFGNYFETKKEAEKAVEKLKAWKRLKDAGFTFNNKSITDIEIGFIACGKDYDRSREDLDLLFSGEDN